MPKCYNKSRNHFIHSFRNQATKKVLTIKRTILIIAYHYPPLFGGSGIHRITSLQKHLTNNGWNVHILAPHPRVYEAIEPITSDSNVHTCFALNTSKHLSIQGKYSKLMSLPDNWVSWWFGAVPKGLQLIRKYNPDCILSSYPIATTNLIALTLNILTKTPWIADFRDPMVDDTHPYDISTRSVYSWIEKKTIANCRKAVFTTESTKNLYLEKFPCLTEKHCTVIENGYNEFDFNKLNDSCSETSTRNSIAIIHSGHVYPIERDPTPMFLAIKKLITNGILDKEHFSLLFRGDQNSKFLANLISKLELNQSINLKPLIPHKKALSELYNHDALLILQAKNCNHQIPAKSYEYLRTGKPIIVLTDPNGDTANLLKEFEQCYVADIADKSSIEKIFIQFTEDFNNAQLPKSNLKKVKKYSREALSTKYEKVISDVISKN